MNATLIISASSVLLACVAFAFFFLRLTTSDKFSESNSGTMSFSGEGHNYDLKYQVGDNGMAVTFFINDGTHSALWVKTALEGEYESIEILHNEGETYQVVEFLDDVATSCRRNADRDQDRINKLIDSVRYDGGSDQYSITEDDNNGNPVTILVTHNPNRDVTMPDFDWSSCESIGDPLDEGDQSRRALESMVQIERDLGVNSPADLANKAYNDPSDDERIQCVGNACCLIHECNFAFRGSDDKYDWFANIVGTFQTPVSEGGVNIHNGFYGEFAKLYPKIKTAVEGCTSPVFIGHSLGGAIASVAHTYFKGKGEIRTYAGPGPYKGSKQFMKSEPYTTRSCKWVKAGKGRKKEKCTDTTHTRNTNINTEFHVNGERVFHESDAVPWVTSKLGFNHGGGNGFKIVRVCVCPYWFGCPFDSWCSSWSEKLVDEGKTNLPSHHALNRFDEIGNVLSTAFRDKHSMTGYQNVVD